MKTIRTYEEFNFFGKKIKKENDLDGIITHGDGTKIWYKKGKKHRLDGPAVEWSDGGEEWWVNGKPHRDDGPAVVRSDGTKKWYLNGELHREGGPAVDRSDGGEEWWLNGKLHREDGPAVKTHFSVLQKRARSGTSYSPEDWIYKWYYNGKEYTLNDMENLPEDHPLKRGYIKYKFGL